MNPNTGIISLTNLANFGSQPIVTLNVSVSDGVYNSFARVKIEILPANMHTPEFKDIIVDVQVPENMPAGYLVAVVRATDKDNGPFGTILYSIHSELLMVKFSIDKNNGRITTRKRLDREEQKVYELPIMATDGGGKSGFFTVRVRVTDENDNAPKFVLKEYKASIYFNHSLTVPIIRVKAIDLDEGISAEIEYSIYEEKTSEVMDIFKVNPNSGDLYLSKIIPKSGKPTVSIIFR